MQHYSASSGAAMDPRHLRPMPGSGSGRGSGGSGGQSVNTSARRRRRMSTPLMGTRLMPALNAAAGDTEGWNWGQSSSSSSGGFDLGLDEWHPIYNRRRVHPEFSSIAESNMRRLLFPGSPLTSRTTDDDVLVMDGVLVANTSAARSRSYASFSDIGYGYAGSLGTSGSGRHGSNRQFSYGREESRVVRAMNPTYSEAELQRGRPMQVAGSNMQTVPRGYHHFLPQSLPGAPFPAPRGPTPTPIRPPAAPYFTPARATTAPARVPASSSWVLKQPEVKLPPPAQPPAFSWPPTEEEAAAISQVLYGPRRHRRLPVFESICPS